MAQMNFDRAAEILMANYSQDKIEALGYTALENYEEDYDKAMRMAIKCLEDYRLLAYKIQQMMDENIKGKKGTDLDIGEFSGLKMALNIVKEHMTIPKGE